MSVSVDENGGKFKLGARKRRDIIGLKGSCIYKKDCSTNPKLVNVKWNLIPSQLEKTESV